MGVFGPKTTLRVSKQACIVLCTYFILHSRIKLRLFRWIMRIIYAPLLGKSEELMHEKCLKRKNPWVREFLLGELDPIEYYTPALEDEHDLTNLSRKARKFEVEDDNAFLDINTKRAVLKVSSSVVALLSYTTGIIQLSNLGRCDFDCKELFMGTCKTTICGEGGALINISGEVIGITFFYDFGFTTPFLPINIASKCWEHYKRYGGLWRPSLGFKATNFYTADIYVIEKVIQKIPSICNGVLVEKVIQGSSADSAGLHLKDVIVRCDGKTVHSFLEFLEMVWDKKVGDVLQLFVVRPYQNDPIHVNMVVDEVAVEKFNRWPRNQ
ncbi:hypothetical protein P8452_00978 [Trifolium repens]|nr:hypothetical protein P8452_00978 [Trifolium repens]